MLQLRQIGVSNTKYKTKRIGIAVIEPLPFASVDGERNYQAMYKAAAMFHERHNGISLARFSEKTQSAYISYWKSVTDDMNHIMTAFNNDPFMGALLAAACDELERDRYNLLQRLRTGAEQAAEPAEKTVVTPSEAREVSSKEARMNGAGRGG